MNSNKSGRMCKYVYRKAFVSNRLAGGMLSRLYDSKPYMIKYLVYMSSSGKVQLQFSSRNIARHVLFTPTDVAFGERVYI